MCSERPDEDTAGQRRPAVAPSDAPGRWTAENGWRFLCLLTHLGVNAVVADGIRVDARGASGGRWEAPPAFEDRAIDLLRSAAVTQKSLEPNTLARFVRTAPLDPS